jgi:hypothetical protein
MAGRVPPLPLLHPEIERIMQEDVGKPRADARALGRSFHRIGVHATLQDAGAEPLANQPQHSPVGNPVRQHPRQPVVVDAVKRLLDRLPITALIISTTIPIR